MGAGWAHFFAAFRAQKTSTNHADRLRKYLARFGPSWQQLSTPPAP